ncbi:phenylacetate--CoA ligase family protein [Methanolobus profundi]|uniref:Phenylacetate-CoA ligase n=1 Tax=Methanolobus profundi TaxID=487685 RepID=A0A1I4RWD0_9EURY|nr:phenylacetate--CoA ligase family protein [Methanolobus profundi]SFM56323.1 phenylacetate-CoA ligase [Methanolobus profundi]
MLQKQLFRLAHQLQCPEFNSMYDHVVKNQWNSYEAQKLDQEQKLRYMIKFSYEYVPYYHKLFKELGLRPEAIKTIEDLEKLPILNKEIIKKNWDDFKPRNLKSMQYYNWTTGGSTGTPLKYRLSKPNRFLGAALLYRGWGYAGYKPGDKKVFLAGTSLDVGSNPYIIKKIHEITRNLKKLSAFDMNELEMNNYVNVINSFKPKMIRGYASSINFLAKYIDENGLHIESPLFVSTTSEKLYPDMREKIINAFNCDVFDAYGLTDGGVGAYECHEHNGLHIDTERSIMEISSNDGEQINSGVGKILATNLGNFAMPFIRYDTGDLGDIIEDSCSCGRGSRLLKEVIGRDKELLITPDGKHVHGAAFYNNMISKFNDANSIVECQILQKNKDGIIFNMVCKDDFNKSQLDYIRGTIMKKNGWDVEFRFVDEIERTKAGKYKFIVNEVSL